MRYNATSAQRAYGRTVSHVNREPKTSESEMTKSKLLKLSASIATSCEKLGVEDVPQVESTISKSIVSYGGGKRSWSYVSPDEAAALLVDWCVREFDLFQHSDTASLEKYRYGVGEWLGLKHCGPSTLAAVAAYLKARVKAGKGKT